MFRFFVAAGIIAGVGSERGQGGGGGGGEIGFLEQSDCFSGFR